MRIEFVGLMGCGKSTTVNQLKKKYPDKYVTKNDVLTEKYYSIIKDRSRYKFYALLFLKKINIFNNYCEVIFLKKE